MLYAKSKTLIKPLVLRGKLMTFDQPKIMGIINVTEDSFYSSSRVICEKEIITLTGKMIEEGVNIVDIGACSTRPGSIEIPLEIEKARIYSTLKSIKKHFPDVFISVDTFRSEIVKVAYEEGADIINDISAGRFDPIFFSVVAQCKMPYILMHSRGTPQTMSQQTEYTDLITEIIDFFQNNITELTKLGINQIIIDPGFGFAKTIEQNYQLLNNLYKFQFLDKTFTDYRLPTTDYRPPTTDYRLPTTDYRLPILVGISRKSMIYKVLKTEPSQAMNGTTVLNTLAIINGADILRVHDVREAKEILILLNNGCNV